MKFNEAMKLVKDGKCVTRTQEDVTWFYYSEIEDEVHKDTVMINIRDVGFVDGEPTGSYSQEIATIDLEDVFADDWVEYTK